MLQNPNREYWELRGEYFNPKPIVLKKSLMPLLQSVSRKQTESNEPFSLKKSEDDKTNIGRYLSNENNDKNTQTSRLVFLFMTVYKDTYGGINRFFRGKAFMHLPSNKK